MKANLYPGRGTRPDWNDIEIMQRDRKPPHAYRIPFPDMASCRHAIADNRRYLSPYVIVLNQGWECRHYPNILQLPENILSFRSGFEKADVPGYCQAAVCDGKNAGKGGYPFPVIPPMVPQEQPVIVYRRTCRLPLFWGGLRKHLVMQGVRSACHIFMNGHLAGFTQGTGLPAEFDLTPSLHDGDNELFILVYPECSGRYLENPAATPWPGLIRDVYFEAVPPVALEDIRVKTLPSADPDDDSWTLDLTVSVVSCRISLDSPQVRISLSREGQPVSESSWMVHLETADASVYAPPVQTTGILKASIQVFGVQPWNDEDPQLYDLFIGLEERGSRELACVHQLVGFRHLDCKNGELRINGKPLLLKAAILPTQLPGQPSAAKYTDLISELKRLKQNHLNTLYIRHYPADPILLELCDIFGVFVIDEAPLETAHPLVREKLAEDPAWMAAAADRLERLIRRDMNHPCVVMWSAGLLREKDALSEKMAAVIREYDGSRFIHLADAPDCAGEWDLWNDGREEAASLAWLRVPEHPGIGRCYYETGHVPQALLDEIRHILRPLEIKVIDASSGAFSFTNQMNWTPSSAFKIGWVLLRNGKLALSGELDSFRAEPGAAQFIEIWYGEQNFQDGADYLIRFEISWAESSLWHAAGDSAFSCEFPVASSVRAAATQSLRSGGRLRLESDRHHLIVSGSRFWLVFNRVNGALESWRIGDKELLAAMHAAEDDLPGGISGILTRSPDILDKSLAKQWLEAGYNQLAPLVMSVEEGCDGQSAVIEMVIQLAPPGRSAQFEWISRYEIFAAGDLRYFVSLTPLEQDLPVLPCFGLHLAMKTDFDQISWYGAGPKPGLARLQASRRCGVYQAGSQDLEKMHGSEGQGLFTGTHWLSLKDKSGFGLTIRSDQHFGFAVKAAEPDEYQSSILEYRANHRPLQIELFQPLADPPYAQPAKAVWHLCPVVSDSGKS